MALTVRTTKFHRTPLVDEDTGLAALEYLDGRRRVRLVLETGLAPEQLEEALRGLPPQLVVESPRFGTWAHAHLEVNAWQAAKAEVASLRLDVAGSDPED